MPPPSHNFRSSFTLIKNPNNPTNVLTCEAFYEANTEKEVQKILALPESETNKFINLHADLVISTVSSHSSINSRQSAISNFLCRPFSVNDQSRFEQLLLRMIVFNALPFTFVKNEDTIAVFEFLVPGLKLPKCKVIGGKGVVFITTNGQPLIWGAHDISSERSQTQNVINHIEQLMIETEEKRIIIKAFVSDSTGKYAAIFLNKLQKDTARLYEVLHCFEYMMKIFECHDDFEFKTNMRASELIKYKWEINSYDIELFKQFKRNLADFWESTKGQSKVLAMSQIHGDILWSCKVKNAKKYDNQIRRLHVTAPILSDEGDEGVEELVITDLDYQVSDDGVVGKDKATRSNWTNQSLEKNKESVAEEEQRWKNLVNEWIELGDHENQFENKDDKILLSSEWDADFSLGGREKHPANNETAKWSLDLFFVSSLEMPLYFDSEFTFN
ncbi:7515_t:CDS:2 [Cetraspora pellucida]|uniref:7515_t:CDS:1 n=1 Tax=Cetraspora pellucida TaxID=1433469 RepID=A0A9N9GHN8_9GLOM|nr:7515_t:CDS:2 [Cetraspora pellucida]